MVLMAYSIWSLVIDLASLECRNRAVSRFCFAVRLRFKMNRWYQLLCMIVTTFAVLRQTIYHGCFHPLDTPRNQWLRCTFSWRDYTPSAARNRDPRVTHNWRTTLTKIHRVVYVRVTHTWGDVSIVTFLCTGTGE